MNSLIELDDVLLGCEDEGDGSIKDSLYACNWYTNAEEGVITASNFFVFAQLLISPKKTYSS